MSAITFSLKLWQSDLADTFVIKSIWYAQEGG